jgi:membrane protease subunit HflK
MHSDPLKGLLRDADQPGGTGGGGTPGPARRASSVTLRDASMRQTGDDTQAMLDPANQSLAEALSVMLGLVKIAMFVLVALFAMSNLTTIKEGERGVELLLGKISRQELEPGTRWTWPVPVGEVVRVDQGFREINLDKPFWVFVPEGTVDPSPDKLMAQPTLKPDQGGSGSVLTADGNIAHTKWKVGFFRTDVAKYSQNVLPADEENIVRSAAMRGVVQAVASITVDELLKQSGEGGAGVAARAKAIAQETLDRFQSGIQIQTMSMTEVIPPLAVRNDFNRSQQATTRAAQQIEEARRDGSKVLLETVGDAKGYLVAYLDRYEDALARKDDKDAARILDIIDRLMLGLPVTVEGGSVDLAGTPATLEAGEVAALAGGEVANMLAEAQGYRATVVNAGQSSLKRYSAMLEQFRSNPLVMVQREWIGAVSAFMDRDSVQRMYLPPGAALTTLSLNRDPEAMRAGDLLRKRLEQEKTDKERMDQLRREQFKTNTGLTEAPS